MKNQIKPHNTYITQTWIKLANLITYKTMWLKFIFIDGVMAAKKVFHIVQLQKQMWAL